MTPVHFQTSKTFDKVINLCVNTYVGAICLLGCVLQRLHRCVPACVTAIASLLIRVAAIASLHDCVCDSELLAETLCMLVAISQSNIYATGRAPLIPSEAAAWLLFWQIRHAFFVNIFKTIQRLYRWLCSDQIAGFEAIILFVLQRSDRC